MGALWAITPSVIIGVFFWLILRSISRADRQERRAYTKVEQEERARAGLPPKPKAPAESNPDAETPPQQEST